MALGWNGGGVAVVVAALSVVEMVIYIGEPRPQSGSWFRHCRWYCAMAVVSERSHITEKMKRKNKPQGVRYAGWRHQLSAYSWRHERSPGVLSTVSRRKSEG